jgi:hypothetical protein
MSFNLLIESNNRKKYLAEPSSSVASEEIGDATRQKQAVMCALGGEGQVRLANCGNNGSHSPHYSHFLTLHNLV